MPACGKLDRLSLRSYNIFVFKNLVSCCSMYLCLLTLNPTIRVRLFKRGDSISDAIRQRRLQREYKRMSELAQLIFWSSVGREGAYHFQEQLKQKRMAESLFESVAGGISVEKAQKMIKSSIEAQKKSNSARAAGAATASASHYRSRTSYSRSRGRGRGGRGRARGSRGRGRGTRARGRGRGRGSASAGGRSSSASTSGLPG